MNNYDQEPATRPLNQPPVEARSEPPVTQPPVNQPKPPKKRRSAWSTVAFLFLILLVIASLAAAFFWYQLQSKNDRIEADSKMISTQSAEINNLRSENAELNGSLKGLEGAASLSAGNDEEQIKKAAEQYNQTLASPLSRPTVELVKRDTQQAIATVSSGRDMYQVYLKQINGRWTPVWAGQKDPSPEVRQMYGLSV